MKEQYLQALMFVARTVQNKTTVKATEYIRLALEADRVCTRRYIPLLFTLYSPDKDKIETQKWGEILHRFLSEEYGAEPPAALKKLMGIV